MNCQRNFKQCLAVIVGLLAFPQLPALAQTTAPQDPQQLYELRITVDRIIPALKEAEMLANTQGYAANEQQLLIAPPYNAALVRQLPQFWRMKVKQEDVGLLEARYEIKGGSGPFNPFNNVLIKPLGIKVISSEPNGNTIVEGGLSLEFSNFANYGNQDRYSGNLSVCVKRTDSTNCL